MKGGGAVVVVAVVAVVVAVVVVPRDPNRCTVVSKFTPVPFVAIFHNHQSLIPHIPRSNSISTVAFHHVSCFMICINTLVYPQGSTWAETRVTHEGLALHDQ